MSGFNTGGQDVKQSGQFKGLNPGVVNASIFDAIVRTSSSGKKQLVFTLVGKTNDPNFEGWDIDRNDASKGKFKGPSASVAGSIYVGEELYNKSDVNENPIINKFVVIATELGLRTELDAISANSLEEWVTKATAIVKDKPLFFFLNGAEELYNDKVRVKLSLPKYKFAAEDQSKLDTFDKNNTYHFKKLQNAGSATAASSEGGFDATPFDI